ncbi:hypothetical protein [Vibrio coralliilyticus]|uniref:hypothetical protein n=1 Tax=Vibrio coralliilyticus TaxID=190893 RepID=UPI0015607182|nr:hypothetical protein [Vibrio coralliilyticus]NRF14118.1 hypothetical protein [Vibrio coralliilyticus]
MGKSKHLLSLIIIFTTLIIISIVSFYAFHFQELEISTDPEKWGPFGDFFGGVLNPILAFFSFLALLYTIHIQQNELELTREELKSSVSAQKDTATFAKNQNEISERQIKEMEINEKKNDIYKIISTIDKKVSSIFDTEVPSFKTKGNINFKKVFDYLESNKNQHEYDEKILNMYKVHLVGINRELNELFKLVDVFSEFSKHEYLKEYYTNIYGDKRNICKRLLNE